MFTAVAHKSLAGAEGYFVEHLSQNKVRAALKIAGRLGGEEKEFQVFDSLSWTEAQKRDVRQYRPGMAIRFHRGKGGKDETVAVVAVDPQFHQGGSMSPSSRRQFPPQSWIAGRLCFDE